MNLRILGELDRIAQKIDKDLFESVRVLVNGFILDFYETFDCYSVSL